MNVFDVVLLLLLVHEIRKVKDNSPKVRVVDVKDLDDGEVGNVHADRKVPPKTCNVRIDVEGVVDEPPPL